MNSNELISIIIIIFIGGILLRWAHVHGLRRKLHFEKEAIKQLTIDLAEIYQTIETFTIYRYIKWFGKEHGWGKVTYKVMKKEIIQNCTKYTGGNGDVYSSSSYSIYINKNNKSIHYVIDTVNYDFSEIE